jgi:hypothetical protein
MRTKRSGFVALFGGSLAIVAAAVAGAVVQGSPDTGTLAGSDMTTGVTVTATTAPSGMPIPLAQPGIKGPAPLPLEEQGLPG